MKDDPAIKAIRDARRSISESVQHDPRKLVEYYKKLQERHRDKLVSKSAEPAKIEDESAV